MSDTLITPEVKDADVDEPKVAHYVYKSGALVPDGQPQRALCGKMWVPTTYDPAGHTICQACKEIGLRAGLL